MGRGGRDPPRGTFPGPPAAPPSVGPGGVGVTGSGTGWGDRAGQQAVHGSGAGTRLPCTPATSASRGAPLTTPKPLPPAGATGALTPSRSNSTPGRIRGRSCGPCPRWAEDAPAAGPGRRRTRGRTGSGKRRLLSRRGAPHVFRAARGRRERPAVRQDRGFRLLIPSMAALGPLGTSPPVRLARTRGEAAGV